MCLKACWRRGLVQRFEELEVWKESRRLAKEIYAITAHPSFKADWDLCRQVRRAAISAMSNIAEGFERENNKEFIRFLLVAKGSAGEVRSQLYLALDLQYGDRETVAPLLAQYAILSRRLSSLIEYLKNCDIPGHKFLELPADYIAVSAGSSSNLKPGTSNQSE